MTALLVQVATEITTELGSFSFGETITPVRSYADWDDVLEDQNTLHVDVVPAMMTEDLLTRAKHRYTCTVSVLLRKRFNPTTHRVAASGRIDNQYVDGLIEKLQLLYEFFAPSQPSLNGRKLSSMPAAAWSEASGIKAPYSRRMLREHSQYSGFLSLVYLVPRAFG